MWPQYPSFPRAGQTPDGESPLRPFLSWQGLSPLFKPFSATYQMPSLRGLGGYSTPIDLASASGPRAIARGGHVQSPYRSRTRVTLTPEEAAFCRVYGIPYAAFARHKLASQKHSIGTVHS